MYNLQDYYKLIDASVILNILENHGNNKKIFCFGAGTAGEGLINIMTPQCHIDCFLDNNPTMYTKKINGIPVCSPDILTKEQNYIVLVNSQHKKAICEQLKSYCLVENVDFFVIYDLFDSWCRIEKFRKTTNQFCNFIKQIPDDIFDNIQSKENHYNIGIVCMNVIHRCTPWRDITAFLLLLLNGYRVSLLIDDLDNILEYYIKEHKKYSKYFLEQVLDLLSKKFSNLQIIYYDKSKKEKLDENDKQEVVKLLNLNLKYFDSLVYYDFGNKNNLGRTESFQNTLIENMSILLAFFQSHKFDVVHLCGGVAEHQGVYTWIGKKLGFRISTYDGTGTLGSLVSSSFPCVHYLDIVKTVDKNYFTVEEKEVIANISKKHFNNRKNFVNDPAKCGFQIVGSNKNKVYNYDFLIPLNIDFDSSALGLDLVFSSTESWLEETITFILEHTNSNIIIREHPAQCILDENTMDRDYFPLIKKFSKNRCTYIKAGDSVNTYDVLDSVRTVLPFASTVGVEAAIMNKCVITHTSCYYSYSNFVLRAENKQQYFDYILESLQTNKKLSMEQQQEAYLYYYFLMNSAIKTNLTELNNLWMNKSLFQLNDDLEIRKLLDIVTEEQTACYLNVKETLSKVQNNYN